MRQCDICPVWVAQDERLCAYHDKLAAGLIGRVAVPAGLRLTSDVVMTDEDRELAAGLRAMGCDEVMVAQAVRRKMGVEGRRP